MNYLRQVLKNKDLLKKILYILFILLIFRIMAHIPIPGPSPDKIQDFFNQAFSQSSILPLFDIFSGGGTSRFSVALMGLGPYITASIMIQLMTVIFPKFEKMSKESESSRQKINQYTRYITVPLAFVEGFGLLRLLDSTAQRVGVDLLGGLSITQWFIMLLSITAGTVFLMWLGENITEKGLGNGISMIIFAGILAALPGYVGRSIGRIFGGDAIDMSAVYEFGAAAILAIAMVLLIVFITEAKRKIPISYAKKVRGLKTYGAIDTHLPLKLNMAGVIPIIFAGAFLNIPRVVGYFSDAQTEWVRNAATFVSETFDYNTIYYAVFYFALVFFFTFFSAFLYFKPKDVAENVQKQGGFIPGIRPGTQTENFLNYLLMRVTLWGAIFLSFVAVFPFAMQLFTNTTALAIGGTGILIVVSVAIEIMNQLKAQIITRNYEEIA